MKKSICIAGLSVLAIATIPQAFAANISQYGQGTQVSYQATENEEWTITVPAKLNPGQSGNVVLSGKWPSNKLISVTAEDSVTLTNNLNSNNAKVLDIDFDGILNQEGNNTTSKTYTQSISVANMPSDVLFGVWSGTFYYNVETRGSNFQYNTWYALEEGTSPEMPVRAIAITPDNIIVFYQQYNQQEVVTGQKVGPITMQDNALHYDNNLFATFDNSSLTFSGFSYKKTDSYEVPQNYFYLNNTENNVTYAFPIDDCTTWADFLQTSNMSNRDFYIENGEVYIHQGSAQENYVVNEYGQNVKVTDTIYARSTYAYIPVK